MEVITYMGVFGIASLITCFFILWQRSKWQHEADVNVQIRIIPRAGKSHTMLGKVEGDMVVCAANKKKGIPGRIYPIDEVATYEADYPSNFPIAFMRTNIKEMAVYSWNWEPISNPTDETLMSPEKLYNFVNEKFSSLFLQYSQGLAEAEAKLQKALARSINPNVVYVLLGLNVVGVGYLIYTFMPLLEQLQNMIDDITALAKAFGV